MTDIVTRTPRIPVEPGVKIDAYAALPRDASGRPAVLVLGEIWGINANIRATCDRLAEAGAIALAPDQYRGIQPPRDGEPMDRVLGFFDRFDDPQGIRDARAHLDFLARGEAGAKPGSLYVWGFCKGGRFAHYLSAFDRRLAGAINFYGRLSFARQANLKPFTPLDVTGLVACPYLGLFAGIDPFIPREDVEALGHGFRQRGHPHHLHIYDGAEHAFFNDTRHSFQAAAAADAWEKARGFILDGRLP